MAGLVIRAEAVPPGTVLHANHPSPTNQHTVIETVARHTGLPLTNQNISRKHLSRAGDTLLFGVQRSVKTPARG